MWVGFFAAARPAGAGRPPPRSQAVVPAGPPVAAIDTRYTAACHRAIAVLRHRPRRGRHHRHGRLETSPPQPTKKTAAGGISMNPAAHHRAQRRPRAPTCSRLWPAQAGVFFSWDAPPALRLRRNRPPGPRHPPTAAPALAVPAAVIRGQAPCVILRPAADPRRRSVLFFAKAGGVHRRQRPAIVPFLARGLVVQHHWLTSSQVLERHRHGAAPTRARGHHRNIHVYLVAA